MLLTHLGFIVFVVFGGLLILRWRWIAFLHLPSVVWGALVELGGWVCPLTPLENWLREASGLETYSEGFIEHLVRTLVYPAGLTRRTQILLGVAVVVVNTLVYLVVWRRWRRRNDAR